MNIYLDIDPALQQLLDENQIDLKEVLTQENIDAEIQTSPLPVVSAGAKSKDIVTLVIASGAAISLISLAISKLLHTLHQKPHWVEYEEPVELRDAQGNILLDKDGKPLFKIVKKSEFIVPPSKNKQSDFEVNFTLQTGIIIRWKETEGNT